MANSYEHVAYTSGEVLALVAPLVACDPGQLQGVVILGVPRPSADLDAVPMYTDAPSIPDVIALLAHTITLMTGDLTRG